MADYNRKNVNNAVNSIKLRMEIGALSVKMTENINKINDLLKVDKDIKKDITDNSNAIKNFYTKQDVNNIISQYYLKKYLYNKEYIDENFLTESEIDKKDNEILTKVNDNFYSRSYINTNYYLKHNIYNKEFIDDNFYTKNQLNNSFSSVYTRVDQDYFKRDYIKNNYYDKNYINNLTNNLYNRTHLDTKFDDIYSKSEVDSKTAKLNRNFVIFNQHVTKFIDVTYKEDKDNMETNITNISNINNEQNSRIEILENFKLNETQINNVTKLQNYDLNKINSSYNFSVFNKQKIDKMRYSIRDIILHDINLTKNFEIQSDINELLVNEMNLDRDFNINDILKINLNLIIKYTASKSMYHTLFMRLDLYYNDIDQTLIKSFDVFPISKGFVFLNNMSFNVDRIIKLFKKTDKIIFKIFFERVPTNTNILVSFSINDNGQNYMNIEWLSMI